LQLHRCLPDLSWSQERERGDEDIVESSMDKAFIIVNEVKVKVDLTKYVEKYQFNFDDALDESVTNEQVYKCTVEPLVHTLFKQGKSTCFAYGQTGSGKTHTMSPLPVRAAADILQYLTLPHYQDINLWVSCFEIYGNKCFDLLHQRKKLNILEDGKKKVVVVGLKEHVVESVEYLQRLIEESATKRSVGSTAANADSSRSHSIMQFVLKKPTPDGEGRLIGKISFIDLAGSERGADTFDNDRVTRMEGAEINKSLLALKECIRALDADARHVPFRGSKLTAVLRDSFVGATARTVMIACIGPNSSSVEHTLNTLRYADRVKGTVCTRLLQA
jgi:kinesin family member 2/24